MTTNQIAENLVNQLARIEIEYDFVLPTEFRQYPDALAEFNKLEGVSDYWFDLAYGVTPSLFVMYDKDDDPRLARIRLMDDAKVREWLGVEVARMIPAQAKGAK